MLRLKLILLPSVLALALPVWAESGTERTPGAHARPLNLSLPRDVLLHMPAGEQPDETVLRNLDTSAQTRNKPDTSSRPAHLPYGAGYEHRQQEMRGTGGSTPGAGAAGSGRGRRGR